MKLFLIRRPLANYDEVSEFLIRARSEKHAREMIVIQKKYADEGKEVWLDPELSSCVEVKIKGVAEIITRDFNAG